jgi:C4-dicarboxylate-specific signal transduction histidine kinase
MFGRTLSLDRPTLDVSGLLPRYALAVAAVVTASVANSILQIFSAGAHNLFVYFAAIVFTAWYGGAGPGWVAVVMSALAADFFFVRPIYRIEFEPESFSWLVAFLVCGAMTNAVCFRRRRMEKMLQHAREELEDRVRVRTLELRQVNAKLIAEMTERIRAETALRQTQGELSRAARIMTVTELTASIAHEINQPLAAVVSNGEAAQNWLRRSPPALPQVAESIEAVVVAGVRAAEIIARIRRLITKAIPRQTTVELNELVSEVLKLARADLAKRNIVIRCRLATGLPSVTGDRIQLQQMLLNLVNNASDAMVEVFDRQRELVIATSTRGNDSISVMVSDTGHGFSNPDTNKIFQAFYSTKQGGMGIGLSVCRTVAESHGGSIRATAQHPHGAIFEVDLPAVQHHG